jgi:uncharacterized membrane protein (UPF0127 family)
MNRLSLEKQFEHELFLRHMQTMSLETMKKVMADLHLIYLGQQTIIAEILKQPAKLEDSN